MITSLLYEREFKNKPNAIKWLNRYCKLIAYCQSLNQQYNETTERHHIIPRSWGGSDNKHNLVNLTFRQHILAHYMLYKTGDLQMAAAFFCMLNVDNDRYNFHVTNIQYQQIRESAREQYKYRHAVPVIRLDTEQTFISASEAERIINAPKSAVANAIRDNHRLYGTWWMRLDDFLAGKRPVEKPKTMPKTTKQIQCIETGQIFASLTQLTKTLNLPANRYVTKAINENDGLIGDKHYRYIGESAKTGPKPVINLDTGETFPCARDAAKHYGFRPGGITAAIHQGTRFKGYRWKYIDE